jgi:hypothetical protein
VAAANRRDASGRQHSVATRSKAEHQHLATPVASLPPLESRFDQDSTPYHQEAHTKPKVSIIQPRFPFLRNPCTNKKKIAGRTYISQLTPILCPKRPPHSPLRNLKCLPPNATRHLQPVLQTLRLPKLRQVRSRIQIPNRLVRQQRPQGILHLRIVAPAVPPCDVCEKAEEVRLVDLDAALLFFSGDGFAAMGRCARGSGGCFVGGEVEFELLWWCGRRSRGRNRGWSREICFL